MKYRVFQIDKKRVVEEAEARIWAETKGYHYFETSAQTGEGVSEMFQVRTDSTRCLEAVSQDNVLSSLIMLNIELIYSFVLLFYIYIFYNYIPWEQKIIEIFIIHMYIITCCSKYPAFWREMFRGQVSEKCIFMKYISLFILQYVKHFLIFPDFEQFLIFSWISCENSW